MVILGAGASFDCASGNGGVIHEEWRPPLVTQLFENRPSFTRVLHDYPLAEQAAAEIRPSISDGSIAIEAFLRDRLRDSPYEHERRQYWAVPLYLQHLLFEISMWDYGSRRGYAEQPDSYDRLINVALRADEVTFVTLNYDDLFDRRLFMHSRLDSMESYLGVNEKWSLIKLHGSINWGRLVKSERVTQVRSDDIVLAQAFADLRESFELDDEIHLRRHTALDGVRGDEVLGDEGRFMHLYYPALAAPLGAEDELVCPPDHVAHLKQITGHWEPLDVLVIGYSGLDQEVLTQLSWGGRSIRSLCVVSDRDETADATARRIVDRVRVMPAPGQEPITIIGGGFTNFAQSSALPEYIERIQRVAASEDSRRPSLGAFNTE
jgi:hypothetical protein